MYFVPLQKNKKQNERDKEEEMEISSYTSAVRKR